MTTVTTGEGGDIAGAQAQASLAAAALSGAAGAEAQQAQADAAAAQAAADEAAAQAPEPALMGPCSYCEAPLVAFGRALWHRHTGCVSCEPLEEWDGYAEPEGWWDGPCATVGLAGDL